MKPLGGLDVNVQAERAKPYGLKLSPEGALPSQPDDLSSGNSEKLFSKAPWNLVASPWAVALLFALVGFWLRLAYLRTINPFVDEFGTMFAARMIVAHGVPVMPSGLWYTHGLLFNYLDALAIGLLGFSEAVARWPSLIVSVLTIPLLYAVGRRLFSAPVGLVAAATLALAPEAVVWGGRARMYALLQGVVLLAVWVYYEGAVAADRPRLRAVAWLAFLAATLAQFEAVLLFPPLVVAGWWLGPRARRRRAALADVLAGGLIVFSAFLVRRYAQPPGTPAYQPPSVSGWWGLVEPVVTLAAKDMRLVSDWPGVAGFLSSAFLARDVLPLTVLAAFGLIGLVRWRDRSLAYLYVLYGGCVLELVAVTNRTNPRYLFMLLPVLMLAAAATLVAFGRAVGRRLATPPWAGTAGTWLMVGAVVAFWLPSARRVLTGQELGYNWAFRYVAEHRQPGDVIVTIETPGCALYLGRCDYFWGDEHYRRFYIEKDGVLVDRWAAMPVLESWDELQRVLAGHDRVWLVADRYRLRAHYDPALIQQIFARMDSVFDRDNVEVFLSRGRREGVGDGPQHPMQVNLADTIRFLGYTADPETVRAGEMVRLVLFWQAQQPVAGDYTVFIHLRDAGGGNVAQQDHQPFNGALPTSQWPPGQTIREESRLAIPPGVPPGRYHLKVGLYLLSTLERLPVVGDTSGENAIELGTITVRNE